jgi:hypothetical protein
MSTLYRNGDELEIVAGLYKKYRHATYLRPCGTKMCAVKVNGIAEERNLRLTSIRKARDQATSDNGKARDKKIVLTKHQYDDLLNDIKALTRALDDLQMKVKRLEKSC